MEGVVQRGTARKLKELGRPLAGKTGTTNKSKDTWFIGYSPDLVVGVFVGFDEPKSLGKRETGSSVAAPIWGDFMKQALADVPPMPFRVPSGMKNVRVNAKTGRLAKAGDENAIWEAFVAGTEPGSGNFADSADVIGPDGKLIPQYNDDPYGYDDDFGYEDEYVEDITGNPSVEVYDEFDTSNNSGLSYFSNRKRQLEQGRSPERVEFPLQDQNNHRPTYQPNGPDRTRSVSQPPRDNNAPAYRPPAVSQPPKPDPNFTGTGGIY